MLFGIDDIVDYTNNTWKKECEEETDILMELGQLHGIAARWWHDIIAMPLLPHSTAGWKNKHEKNPEFADLRYNFKFYVVSNFFEGETLYKYLRNNDLSLEETLKILLTVLEELQELHKKNIIHGDLSFKNILIKKNSNGKIEIHLIDFGFSGKMKNGIKKYPFSNYKFEYIYVPPECDPIIAPQLVSPKVFKAHIVDAINDLANAGYGFNTVTSDLYSLGWWIYYHANKHNVFEIFKDTLDANPYYRPTLGSLISRCKRKYLQQLALDSELVFTQSNNQKNDSQDLCSLFDNLGFCGLDNAPLPNNVLTSYNTKSALRSCDSSNTLSSLGSSDALSSCNTSNDDLNSLPIIEPKPTTKITPGP